MTDEFQPHNLKNQGISITAIQTYFYEKNCFSKNCIIFSGISIAKFWETKRKRMFSVKSAEQNLQHDL